MSVDISRLIAAEQRKNAHAAALEGVKIFQYREPLKGSEWADKYFYLSPESSSVEGRWKSKPYQIAMLNWMCEDDCEELNIRKSKRLGYTKCLLAAISCLIEHKRRNIALWQPTDGDRDRFSKTEVDSILRDVPVLGDALRCNVGAKNKYNTIEQKTFYGCTLDLKGGKSGGSYRAMTKDVAAFDELDAFDRDVDGEGAPTELGDGRLEDSSFPKSIRGTTPKIKSTSLIEAELKNCEHVFYRFVPCPHCGHLHKLEFKNLKWDNRDPKTARMICPENGCEILYNQYPGMDEKGRWQTDDGTYYRDDTDLFYNADSEVIPRPVKRGMIIWAAYSYFRTWSYIATKWIEASAESKAGKDSKLKTATNTVLGESWEDKGDSVSDDLFSGDRLDDYHTDAIPNEVLMVTFGADVQGGKNSRIEIEFTGWGLGEESWSLDYVVIPGDPEGDDIWQHLDDQTLRKFVREDGIVLPVSGGMIDSGYLPGRVFQFTRPRKRRNIYATKGKAQYSGPLLGKGSIQGDKVKALQFPINTDEAKETVFNRLNKIHEPGPGYCHFPKHYAEPDFYEGQYFKRLTNEEKRPDRRAGTIVGHKWFKLGPNEPLDCRVGNMAAFIRLNKNLRQLKELYDAQVEHTRLELPMQTRPQMRSGRRVRSGGVTV